MKPESKSTYPPGKTIIVGHDVLLETGHREGNEKRKEQAGVQRPETGREVFSAMKFRLGRPFVAVVTGPDVAPVPQTGQLTAINSPSRPVALTIGLS